MKHQEFYRKYKTTYSTTVNQWNIPVAIAVAALIEPFLMYRRSKQVAFSFHFYWQQLEYFTLFALPFGLFLIWVYWKESEKKALGYCWVGKFRVIDKKSSWLNCYLILAPNETHKLKVNRDLFNKTQIGDSVVVRRDALGGIDEVKRITNVLSRVSR